MESLIRLISETNIRRQKLLVKSKQVSACNHRAEEFRFSFISIDQKIRVETIGEYHGILEGEGEIFRFYGHDVEVMGSCDGLLLIREFQDLFLWNPSIRYCQKVLSHEKLGPKTHKMVSGLFFNSHHNEYKALFVFTDNYYSTGFVSVGCFKTKTWTRVPFDYYIFNVRSGPVFLNNNLHWVASKTPDFYTPPCSIIYFDSTKNEFVELPMPQPNEQYGNAVFGLGVLDGCLCMGRKYADEGEVGVEVLVMKEYGVKESWVSLFRFKWSIVNYSNFSPFFHTEKKGEVLMRVGKDEYGDILIKYDTESRTFFEVKRLKRVEVHEGVDKRETVVYYDKTYWLR